MTHCGRPKLMGDANESRLRGKNLDGSEQPDAVDHTAYKEKRNPDTELNLDNEDDSLYEDGLDVEDDSETLYGTKGNTNRG
jgi:hypothetical protein